MRLTPVMTPDTLGKLPTMPKPTPDSKPEKPYADFPLFPHATKRWAKKIRGKLHYFGPWRDPDGALSKWLEQRDELLAGRTPRGPREGLSVADLCNRFLTHKQNLAANGEITARTFAEYYATCQQVVDAFGGKRLVDDLATDDFEHLRASMAKRVGPVRLGNQVQRVRSLFKYGFDAALVDKPTRYGPAFKGPSRKVLRVARAKKGPKLIEARHIRLLLKSASIAMRAMILLGINGGMGNHDCAMLTRDKLDLRAGWLNYARGKTGVPRRIPLWAETIEAIKAAVAARPAPKDPAHDGLVFLTKYGRPWGAYGTSEASGKEVIDSAVTKEFRKMLDKLDVHKAGIGFYCLRHTFRTVADGSRDRTACDAIMGHVDPSMAGVYVETVADDRLRAVVGYVHDWLFRKAKAK